MTTESEKDLQAALAPRYRLVRHLGQGGTAVVYLATDTKHDRGVALKILRPDAAEGMTARRFEREIALVARLMHPNILALLDSGEAAGRPFFVMPYVAGETLGARMAREGTLPVADAVRLTCEVADALDYAHAAGVIHRDIKPSNILLVAQHAVVADFGASWVMRLAPDSRETQAGAIVGTMEYMSPEQASGDQELDGRSDQYSLALTMYELLTGTLPFKADTRLAMLYQRFVIDPKPLRQLRPDVPEHVERAVERALARDPAQRHPSAGEFAAALLGNGGAFARVITPAPATIAVPSKGAAASAPAIRRPTDETGRAAPSIAVLPFVVAGHDIEDEYLAFGLTEEITSALGRVRSLRVVARTSVFHLRDVSEDVRLVGTRLGVRAVLEGSVERRHGRVLVTVRLVETRDGRQLWADQFFCELVDVFDAQEKVARAVVDALKVQLLGQAGRELVDAPTNSPDAYDQYLRGRYAWKQRTEQQLDRSARFFESAIKADPEFAAAHAGLADAQLALAIYGVRAPREVMPAALRAARRALEIDSTAAAAHTTIAGVLATYEWDWAGAEREFEAATVLDPTYATAHHWRAVHLLAPLGRHDEALHAIQRAAMLEPLSPVIAASVGVVQFAARRYGESVQQYERTLDLEPNFGIAHYFLGQTLTQLGALERAIASFEQAMSLSGRSPEIVAALAHACALSGARARADALLAELERASTTRYVSPALAAQVYVALGEHATALDALDRAVTARATELPWLAVRAVWDPLRDSTRFATMLHVIGLPEVPVEVG